MLCSRCKQEKHFNKGQRYCKDCSKEWKYLERYNITLEEYNKQMNTSNTCKLCGSNKGLCYDHDHTTMKFRGVLCMKCNSALGKLGDNEEGLIKALKYLRGEL